MSSKPWFDIEDYKRTRLIEAKFEAELARKFLEEGLLRNAAGKVYQAWKAIVAVYAVDNRDKLKKIFKGMVRLRNGKKEEKVDWIISIMPSTLIKAVAQVIGGNIDLYTNLALFVHEYQYNGADPQGILSPYVNDELAKADMLKLLSVIEELVKEKGK